MLDPKLLPPEQRNSWYQSESKRIQVETRAGLLIPASEHEAQLAVMTKDIAQFLETLPDQLERDVALTPEQVDAMHNEIDRRREELYQRVVSEAAEQKPDTAGAN